MKETKHSKKLLGTLITESWSYHSIFGTGSDYGTRACVYCPGKNLAVLLITRDRMIGAQNTIWEPSDKEDHYYDEQKADIRRKEINYATSLEEQIRIFKETRQGNQEKNSLTKDGYGYSDFKIKNVSLLHEEIKLLQNPNTEKGILYNLLEKIIE
ncbi:MAG: hypothetical protein KKF46_03915 [Nanoarchaeota archaeon]|nr:hypothetical protein [Nanoarchaeota archaeon]MBU1321481.1 hypothetical protein [Nanoarchaeota archaeon]MBU1597313.1 hypothetical protein [Nanoarchaeota archaeon]MBU2441446.1 hypothetical protein [Nanoarchaeota archaeon]